MHRKAVQSGESIRRMNKSSMIADDKRDSGTRFHNDLSNGSTQLYLDGLGICGRSPLAMELNVSLIEQPPHGVKSNKNSHMMMPSLAFSSRTPKRTHAHTHTHTHTRTHAHTHTQHTKTCRILDVEQSIRAFLARCRR
jgi:hypothetical protein